jgi:HlyD family secretion protein
MKKALLTLLVLVAVGGGGYAYYKYRTKKPVPSVSTAAVTRGDIADRVGATGTLQAVTTVQVGTQVSGTIQNLYADFNSLVKKGQVLARLDPSLFQTQIEQARANLIRAQADVERLKVALDDANVKLTRARELSGRQLLAKSDLDAAETTARAAEAQVRSAEAQVTQAQASLSQNDVNLQHTVIAAPIDGLVISRNVDVGQTVAASMQAPTLFILAADLTKMQVVANLDESDVGRIRPGQHVSFRVDAYPTDEFSGTVAQVRLQPIVQQNVVTYATVIDVPNPDLRLKPGMTANVNVEIARRSNVLRVPNTALRFRPTNEIFAALGQAVPPGSGRGELAEAGRAAAPAGQTPTAAPAKPATPASSEPGPERRNRATESIPVAQSASEEGSASQAGRGFNRERVMERLQSLSPEDRQRMLERLRARGFDPTAGAADPPADPPPQRGARAGVPPKPEASLSQQHPQATTIDALFGPLPSVETVGRVWVYVDNQLTSIRVRLGISDGQATELLNGEAIHEGMELVTNVTTGNETVRPATTSTFPGFGQPQRFGGPGGFGGGGGGGGNRGGGGR